MLFLKAFPCFLAPFIFGEVPLKSETLRERENGHVRLVGEAKIGVRGW